MKDPHSVIENQEEEEACLPGLRSWRRVYILVGTCLVFYIFFLAAWSRWFA